MKVGDFVRLKWTRRIAGGYTRGCRCCDISDIRRYAMKNTPLLITSIDPDNSWTGYGLAVEAMAPDGSFVDLETHELTTRGPFK